jgi:SAM-dependent methyltransferase
MPEIISLSREADLEIDYFTEFQRTKKVPNNLFYTSEGAISFYTYRGEDLHQIRWQDEYEFFQRQDFWVPHKSTSFVSLGCGNAEAEKMFLHTAFEQGKSIDYFGIDSSSSMLNLALDNFQNEIFTSTFILADFTTSNFKNTLATYLAPFDVNIFAMIGGTFGNFNQSFIVSELRKMIPSGSFLYLDVVPQYKTMDENIRLRDRLSHLPSNLGLFFKQLLEKLCIPYEAGTLMSVEDTESDIGADRHTFYFAANEKITFPCFGTELTVEAGEKLELLSIRAYETERLVHYMQDQEFNLVDTYIPDVGRLSHLWQRLLFQKV